jgi:hypothetical protein
MARKKRGVYLGWKLGAELEEEASRLGQSVSSVARARMGSASGIREVHDALRGTSPVALTASPVATGLAGKSLAPVRVRVVPRTHRVRQTEVHGSPASADRAILGDIALERDYWFMQVIRLEQERLRLLERTDGRDREAAVRSTRLLVRPLPRVRLVRHRRI